MWFLLLGVISAVQLKKRCPLVLRIIVSRAAGNICSLLPLLTPVQGLAFLLHVSSHLFETIKVSTLWQGHGEVQVLWLYKRPFELKAHCSIFSLAVLH